MTGRLRYPLTFDGETVTVGTANELAVALDVLQGQHDREALEQLQPHLAEVIGNAAGFMLVMRSLSVDDQLFLVQALGAALVTVLQDAHRLRDQLATMAQPEVEAALLKTLRTAGLQKLIMTGTELAEVLEWVYGECDALVLELLGLVYVRRLCRHAADLSAILHNVDATLQEKLLEQLGWSFVHGLVRDGRDLAYLLRTLPPSSSARLLKHFSAAELRKLIANADDWTYLCQRLEPEEADTLFNILDIPIR